MKLLLTLTLLGAGALPALTESTPAAPEAAVRPDETGAIRGRVVWQGERPEAKPDFVFTDEESKGCHHDASAMDKKDRTVLISKDGGVANVVVMVEVKEMKPKVPDDPIVLDQHGCRFEPHVLVVPVGATLRFDNSDETNHNVHTFAKKNQAVNKNIAGGTQFDQVVDKAEVIEVKCDIHPWMKGYVFVTDAAYYAVTDANGNYSLEGLPVGEYNVRYWHEEAGKGKSDTVKVEAGGEVTAELKVGGETKKKAGGRRRR